MKALLLLGGFGTRLRPFTLTVPKPLLSVVNKPFVYYQLSLLKKYNVNEVILGVGYKGEEFKKIFSIAKRMGIKASLSFEKKPLGTAGAIRNAYRFLKGKEPFLVFNGDVLADFDLEKIMNFHEEKKGACVTIGLVKVDNPSAYGLIVTDELMKIQKFIEKPKPEEIISDTINAGVYVMNPEVLEEIPKGEEVSVEKETFPMILEKGKGMYGYIHYGYWIDVGTIDKFKKVNFDLLDGKVQLGYKPMEDNIESEKPFFVYEGVKVDGKLVVGKNTVIVGKGTEIKGKVIIGAGVYIGESSFIKNSIIFDGALIKEKTHITNSIIGKGVFVGKNCELKDIAIADKSTLYDFTKIDTELKELDGKR